MSAFSIEQTPKAVRRRAQQMIRAEVEKMFWMPPEVRAVVLRMMTKMLPAWHEALHEERLLKNRAGITDAKDVRAGGVMVLSNMLATLAANLIVPKEGTDTEAVMLQAVRDLHAIVLENLEGLLAPQNHQPPKGKAAMREARRG